MEGKEIDRNSVPLKFEDIVDKKIYDKMRPPKPGGKIYIINFNVKAEINVTIVPSIGNILNYLKRSR